MEKTVIKGKSVGILRIRNEEALTWLMKLWTMLPALLRI
jgi:hypothetical protein